MQTNVAASLRRPDVDAVVQRLAALFAPVAGESPVEMVRRATSRYVDIVGEPALDGVRIIPVLAGGVPAQWVVADGASTRHRIVHTHGGGWVAGHPQHYHVFAIALARATKASVLLIDYRLAPEHPLPAGLDDCAAALAWAATHGPDDHQDAAPELARAQTLALLGDSAGGALAVALCARTIAEGGRVPDCLVLLGPQLEVSPHPERSARDDAMATQEGFWFAYQVYTGGTVPPSDPRVSPLYTPEPLLRQFPPTLLQTSSAELLLYDSKQFAARLEDAGVRVCLSLWPQMPHVWQVLVGALPEAELAIREIAGFVAPELADGAQRSPPRR
jgi:monoterpene epsilon-lactone hydrolase